LHPKSPLPFMRATLQTMNNEHTGCSSISQPGVTKLSAPYLYNIEFLFFTLLLTAVLLSLLFL